MQADKQAIVSENLKIIKKFIKYPVQLFGVMVIIFGIIPFLIYFNVSRVSGGEENWLETQAEVIAAELKVSVHTDCSDRVSHCFCAQPDRRKSL